MSTKKRSVDGESRISGIRRQKKKKPWVATLAEQASSHGESPHTTNASQCWYPTPTHTHSNEDVCTSCLQGGSLVCCDNCPRAWHTSCLTELLNQDVGMDSLPDVWKCPVCTNTPTNFQHTPSRAGGEVVTHSVRERVSSSVGADQDTDIDREQVTRMSPTIFPATTVALPTTILEVDASTGAPPLRPHLVNHRHDLSDQPMEGLGTHLRSSKPPSAELTEQDDHEIVSSQDRGLEADVERRPMSSGCGPQQPDYQDIDTHPLQLTTASVDVALPSLNVLHSEDMEAVVLGRQLIRFRRKSKNLKQMYQDRQRRAARTSALDEQISALDMERRTQQLELEKRKLLLEEMQVEVEHCQQSLMQLDGDIACQNSHRVQEKQAMGIEGQQILVLERDVEGLRMALGIEGTGEWKALSK